MMNDQVAGFSHSSDAFMRTPLSAMLDHGAQQRLRASEEDLSFDFPPAEHPSRGLFAFSLFVLAVVTFLVWGGWTLIAFAISLI